MSKWSSCFPWAVAYNEMSFFGFVAGFLFIFLLTDALYSTLGRRTRWIGNKGRTDAGERRRWKNFVQACAASCLPMRALMPALAQFLSLLVGVLLVSGIPLITVHLAHLD